LIPGSDFDDEEPGFLRDTSPPRLKKEDSESEERTAGRTSRSRHKRNFDLEKLAFVADESFKSMSSLLNDVHLESGFSSGSSSPTHGFEQFPAESRASGKQDRIFRNPRDPAIRRRKPIDILRPVKRKDIRTIDRLQPGKSKGNLIGNMPKNKDGGDDNGQLLTSGIGKAGKEGRNALLVKTDEAGPKLSLGTVLKSDILDFGKSKHSFTSPKLEESNDPVEAEDEEKLENMEVDSQPTPDISPDSPAPTSELSIESKEEESTNKENDPVALKRDGPAPQPEEKKRDAVKEITNKARPNASAWFKAFGAPKAQATVKKKSEAPPEPPPPVEEKESLWGSAGMPAGPVRRQRKASSSSSMSEPSSLGQDSPLHPVSPGIVSPRGEPPVPPVNGTLRVGFYQDMSNTHKSSPEVQSPHSTHSSPREPLSNPGSPFQGYRHVYPPSSPGTYNSYMVPTPASPLPPQPTLPPPPVSHSHVPQTPMYEGVPQYSYADQYRPPMRTVDSVPYKPAEPVPKPNPSIFPVKKRLFAQSDMARSLEAPKETLSLSNEPLMNRNMYPESLERYNPHNHIETGYPPRSMAQYMAAPQEEKPMEVPRAHEQAQPPNPQSHISRLAVPPVQMGDNKFSAMMESLGRIPSPGRGYGSPLERLMQPPPMNTIQEDSDGVFRNKYTTDSAYQSPNLPHPHRYDNPYYDKNLYLKNVNPGPLPMYQDTPNNPQTGFELNIPKPAPPKPPKKKKAVKSPDCSGNTGFQQYVGLKPTEPTVPPISLKTASTVNPVPGSAFNFGSPLANPLYSEGYLDELRQPAAYYGMAGTSRGSSYPLPQYMGHQVVDHQYQQYLQRVQEEQLRQSLSYPPGYHHALGMRPTYDRPAWL